MKFSENVKSLFTKHNDELYRYIHKKFGNSADAEEIVQDAFCSYLKIGNSEKIDNPRAFLYKTANNLALNHIRKSGYRNAHLNTLDKTESSIPLEREVFAKSDVESLQANLNELPELTRMIFLMNRMDGKSYPEIGRELEVSLSQVQKHMIAALKFLRKNLDRPS